MTSKEFVRELEKAGWKTLKGRGKASHRIMVKGDKEVVIPFHNKDLPKGLLNSLLKKTGLK